MPLQAGLLAVVPSLAEPRGSPEYDRCRALNLHLSPSLSESNWAQPRARWRAMTSRWIWFVPSKICMTLASRIIRSTGKSCV